MRELRIILTVADAERLRGALVTAAAHAALGGEASLFLQLDAVALLRTPIDAPHDRAHASAGLPTLAMLIGEAQALGVVITACQSGLALCDLAADDMPPQIGVSGPVAFLQATDDAARLILL